jgi:D-glycero-D-manno-heptose 1,7-bisphosphate phosphatase
MTIPHYVLSELGDRVYSSPSLEEINPQSITPQSSRLALLDRDGVIVVKAPKSQYHLVPDDIRLLLGVGEAIHIINEEGIPVVVITNQPAVYKGQLSHVGMVALDTRMQEYLDKHHAHIDAVIYCPHPSGKEKNISLEKICTCRKPNPGMVELALRLYPTSREEVYMFGDFESDIQLARNAGINPIYVATAHDEFAKMQESIRQKHPEVFAHAQYPTLLEAVQDIYLRR